MRAHGSSRASAASTSVRGPSVAGIANRPIWLVEVGVFNTTTTAFVVGLVRHTAAGTKTGSVTSIFADDSTASVVPVGVVNTGHSADATVTSEYNRATIGAAAGAGVIWTFGKNGLMSIAGTANGFILNLPTGVGQVFDFYFIWEE